MEYNSLLNNTYLGPKKFKKRKKIFGKKQNLIIINLVIIMNIKQIIVLSKKMMKLKVILKLLI